MKGYWKHWLPLVACLLVVGGSIWFQSQAPAAAEAPRSEESAQAAPATAAVSAADKADTSMWKYLAAALAVGMGCLGGGFAVARIGAAAMGAMSEKPELAGKAMPFAGLAEGICLWGFLVAMLILFL